MPLSRPDRPFTHLLRHGVVAGAAAGAAAAVVMWVMVEPVIRRALVIEDARGGGHDHGGGEAPLVSRTLQVVGGVGTAALVGVMFGVVFAVVFAKVRHRLPGGTDFGRALVLAASGFAVFALLPALKIPANPPAVGDPATVTERTLLYVLTILFALLVIGAVVAADRVLRRRDVSFQARCTLDIVVGVVGVIAILVLVPGSPDAVPADVPAALIWDFRVASLAQLGTMWLAMGVVFGMLVESRSTLARPAVPAGV